MPPTEAGIKYKIAIFFDFKNEKQTKFAWGSHLKLTSLSVRSTVVYGMAIQPLSLAIFSLQIFEPVVSPILYPMFEFAQRIACLSGSYTSPVIS